MVSDFFLGKLIDFVSNLFSKLPDVSVSISNDVFDGLQNILGFVGYVLPMKHVFIILALSIALDNFHIILSIGKTIKNIFSFV